MTKPPGITPWSPPQRKGVSGDDAPVDGQLLVVPGFSDLPSPEMGATDGRPQAAQRTRTRTGDKRTSPGNTTLPPGTVMRPVRPQRHIDTVATVRRSSGQRWLGLTLVILSLCVAIGTFVAAYLHLGQKETVTQASVSSRAQFDSPAAPRATLAARGVFSATSTDTPTGVSSTGAGTGTSSSPDAGNTVASTPTSPTQLAPPITNIAPPPIAPILSPRSIAPQSGEALPAKQRAPTHITIPSIGVNTDIIEVGLSPTFVDGQDVSVWDVAAYAVGHHFSSANPGEGENVVLSGHDDWQGEVFRDLYKLKNGDKIIVQTGTKTWSYHVETRFALQEIGASLNQRLDNAVFIGATGDERLTLITCWPYSVDDHRLIVIARPD